jgi:hypothetical protein
VIVGIVLFLTSLLVATGTTGANAGLLDMLFPTTTRATTTTSTSSTTTSTTPTSTTAVAAANDGLTLKDTGYTRVRITIDNQAAWAWFTLDGTEIKALKVIGTSGALKITSTGPMIGVQDSGQAVIDFVLRIPSGAATGLTMCKNYMGPTKVTIVRLTNAATQVAVVNNTGTSYRPPQGQCENLLHRDISRSGLIGPVRWPIRHDPRPLVLAHYFPWYDADNLHQNYGPDMPTYPADTNDPATVAAAVGLARQSGIDGFVVEYEGSHAYDPRIDSVVAAADARNDFKIGFTIDIHILTEVGWGTITPEVLDTALQKVTGYAGHPSQLLVDGKPVVFVFAASRIPVADWQAGLARLKSATGITPYVISDSDTIPADGTYSFSIGNMPDQAALDQWSADQLNRLKIQPGLVGDNGRLWAAPASPGYDDRPRNRNPSTYIDRANGQRYLQEWGAALTTLPDWVVITSWNEYYEQTHIAPGTPSGNRALDQTAVFAPQFHQTG